MTAPIPTIRDDGPPVASALTVAAFVITVAMSVAALMSTSFMRLMTRDLTMLRAGQWWRVATPVLVQSSGWSQLVFNMLGLLCVGAALERRLSRSSWILVYVVGGLGTVAVLSAWKPDDTGAGSSNAVAALIGALAVVLAASGTNRRHDWTAQVYSIFFASYLTGLALGGVVPSIVAGNLSVILLFTARRAWSPATLNGVCLLVIAVGGSLMAAVGEGHGIGIVGGIAIASLVVLRQRSTRRAPSTRSRGSRQIVAALVGVVAAAELTWFAWVHLLGVDLVVTPSGGGRSTVGWLSVGIVALIGFLSAWVALRWMGGHQRAHANRLWVTTCAFVAVVSVAAPLHSGTGATSRAGLISLHLVCAAVTVAMLAPPRGAQPPHTEPAVADAAIRR